MNVLFVTDSPFFPVRGGADRVVYEQAVRLHRRKHDVAVLCRDKTRNGDQKHIIQGVKGYYLGVRGRSEKPDLIKTFSRVGPLFKHLMHKQEWDVLFFHQPLLSLAVRPHMRQKQAARVYFFHSPLGEEHALRHPGNPLRQLITRRLLGAMEWGAVGQANLVLFASKYMQQRACETHPRLAQKPQEVVPLGVDLSRFSLKNDKTRLREKLKWWPDAPVAFTVRNLERRMGLEGLLEAWKGVVQKEPRALLVIGGNGTLMPALREKIDRWKLQGNVRLTGFIPEEELSSFYQAADFFILPTQELEGFGLVTVEALACGTPVLATHVGGIPEVLKPLDPSLIFTSRRTQVMTDRILQFISGKEWEKFTPEHCREYAEKKFDWEKHVDRLETLLDEAARQRRRGK